MIAHQLTSNKSTEPIIIERKKFGKLCERQLHIIASLPGIGSKLSDRLLKRFGTIRSVFQASQQSIAEVEGVGKSKAQKIRTLLDASYELHKNNTPDQRSLEEIC